MKHARLGIVVVGAAAMLAASVGTGNSSSHREAPLIAGEPRLDSTDTYAFVSPDRPDSVTLIHNVYPIQEPTGGPNFFPFSNNANTTSTSTRTTTPRSTRPTSGASRAATGTRRRSCTTPGR